MLVNNYVVAVEGAALCGEYATKYVSGYTTWNVRVVTWEHTMTRAVSVRLRGVNVEKPSAKALANYTTLREAGLV